MLKSEKQNKDWIKHSEVCSSKKRSCKKSWVCAFTFTWTWKNWIIMYCMGKHDSKSIFLRKQFLAGWYLLQYILGQKALSTCCLLSRIGLRWFMCYFIYILDSSISSSFTFWSSKLACTSRSNWTGIWTVTWNGSWTD